MKRFKINLNLILLITLIILAIISINIGVEQFSIIGLIKNESHDINIFMKSRLPRVLSTVIVGISLSIAGLIMQTITSNKFVSPSTAGTMDFAKLGILFAILFGASASMLTKTIISFVVAISGTMIFMLILKKVKIKNAVLIPLLGLMLGNVVSSISTFIAYRYDLIQNINSWLMGSFTLVTKGNYELLYIGIPFMILAYLYANKFTIAGMGEDFSTSLGLNHKIVVMVGLVIVAVITALVVVTIGTIPFVGLIVPNIISLYRGDNLKKTLPATAMFGAIFVVLGDILSRVIIFPYELSISVVMSVVGSFIFLIIIFRKKAKMK
ncbi:MAG: iron chelate uptake ABC transporter family permease subunit [Bacilli bacterium]